MARMVNSSVSSRLYTRDKNSMRCYVHVLQNCLKSVFAISADNDCFQKIGLDFKQSKRTTEDSKCYGWIKDLPFGYWLIQDVEKRFSSLFLVTASFLKSSPKVCDIIVTQRREIAHSSFEALESRADEDGSASHSYSCLEAIFDVFQVVDEAVVEFLPRYEPRLHKILPSLQYCKTELNHVERDSSVYRDNNTRSPSCIHAFVRRDQAGAEENRSTWFVSSILPSLHILKGHGVLEGLVATWTVLVSCRKLIRSLCDSLDSFVSGDSTFGFSLQSMDSNNAESNELQRKSKCFSLKGQLIVMDP